MKFLEDTCLSPLRNELIKYESHMKSAKSDPKTDPYRSKYLAINSLENMQEKINNFDDTEHLSAIQCGVLSACGVLKAETEEFTLAEKMLSRSLEICDKVEEERFTILARLHSLVYLGVIWCGRDNYDLAREYLEKSLKVYQQFQQENSRDIYTLSDLLNPREYTVSTQPETMESFITHAYFYLAQVEGKAGDTARSAELCHTTLSRQLGRQDFDWMDWAKNSATLSQFYINQENYTAARYHLAAALTVMDQYAANEKGAENVDTANEKEDENVDTANEKADENVDVCEEDQLENFRSTKGHIHRMCSKYALSLLEYSHCEILSQVQETEENVPRRVNSTPEFENLDVSKRLLEVMDQRIEEFEVARACFMWAQQHNMVAQKYFTMEDKCSDYVELTRDMSQMYKHLLAFEGDNDRKCKMHRRRADLLEPLNRELSPEHYLLVIRQILFELGEIFSDLVDLKRERWLAQQNNIHFARKVNLLVNQAVLYFQTFLDTMKVGGKDPEKYNEDSVRPALLAYFYLGRLASKYVVEENSPEQLQNINKTYTNYRQIVDYCTANPEAKSKFSEELEACEEMVRLLPVKMEKIRRTLTV